MRIVDVRDLKAPLNLVYLSLAGWICIRAVENYLRLRFEWGASLTYVGIVFGIYTVNRLTDTVEDFTNDVGRLLFFRHKHAFFFLAVFSLAASTAWLLWAGKLNWVHYLLLSIGIAYSFRIIPWYGPSGLYWTRVKEMIVLKNLSVAFLWSTSIFLVPILYAGADGVDKSRVWLLAIGFAVCTLNNTLFDDIVDEPGDRVAGIKTVPTVWGPQSAILFLMGIDALWIVTACVLSIAYRLGIGHMAFLAGMGLYPLVYLIPHLRTVRGAKAVPSQRVVVGTLVEAYLLCFAAGMFLISQR